MAALLAGGLFKGTEALCMIESTGLEVRTPPSLESACSSVGQREDSLPPFLHLQSEEQMVRSY